MSFTKTSSLLAAAALVATVSAHGIVQGIVAEGKYYPGYNPNYQYQNPPPVVAGWSTPGDQSLGFVSDFTSPDIVCHIGATPGGAYVSVAAGDTVSLEWTVWPASHLGPVMDYLASCNGDCTTVDKTALLFTKIDEAGLINDTPTPGTWASSQMIANNNTWTVTIPSSIAPGKYVLRHETIALHSAENLDGAQAYPQCVNLEITGTGTNTLSTGTIAQSFYKDTDPGIFVNIYAPLASYTIPGPALLAGAASVAPVIPSATATAVPASSAIGSSMMAPFPSATKPATYPSAMSSIAASSMMAPASSIMAPASSMMAPASSAPAYSYSTPAAPTNAPPASSVAPVMSSAAAPPMSSAAAPTMVASSTAPMSFTSTMTGRIGKPTKFTCYVDESSGW